MIETSSSARRQSVVAGFRRPTRPPKGGHYRFYLLVVLLCVPALASAQDRGGRGAPAALPAPKNLQILPKTASTQDVLGVMQTFTRSLGVGCTYCHVEQTVPQLSVEELQAQQAAAAAAAANQQQQQQQGQQQGQQGQQPRARGRGRGGPPPMDYASDARRQKQVARDMVLMTREINKTLNAGIHKPAAEIEHVQCMTCHRGVAIPAQLSDLLRQTMLGKGEGAAVEQYRELRNQYVNTGAYDFGEHTLLDLGRESLAAHKPDDAVAFLQLNVEFFPQSAPSYVELARAHVAKRDRDAAANDLTKALEVDPANAEAKRQLNALHK